MVDEKAFVLGVRALEYALGITCDDTYDAGILSDDIALPAYNAALPIIAKLSKKYNIGDDFDCSVVLDPAVSSVSAAKTFARNGRQSRCLSTQ